MSPAATPDAFPPLPKTFTEAPDEAERDVLARWEADQAYDAVKKKRKGCKPFVFWEGPPTANGRPGIHHVLARTIKDAVCRYRTMAGYRVERKAGWDTHGLPVELEVEKSLGISGKGQIEEFGVAEFNERCRESVWTYRKDWEELSARIGYWLDYDDPYITYDPDYVETLWNLLARFHDQGLAYRGKRVLPYCGRCGTGLSTHELGQPGVYRDVKDPSVTVRFRIVDDPDGASILAWTTTPWTLPSNFALAVHPSLDYVKARVALPVPKGEEKGSRGHEVVWVAAARASTVLGEHEVLDTKTGRELAGTRYLPLFEDAIPRVEPGVWQPVDDRIHQVWTADYVTAEDGTGIVHQAPYGADDWELARREHLPIPLAVGDDGRFSVALAGVAVGTFFKDADDALMDDLKKRGLLFQKAREPHSYPHCWRCDTPLLYFPAPAWYLRVTAFKDAMIELNRQIRWVPADVGTGRFGRWLENLVDWNLSRDRYWGTPLPYWICESCDTEKAIHSRAELEELAQEPLPEGFDNHKPRVDQVHLRCECGGTMKRTPAVADVWFDSGAMPYAQYHWPFGQENRARTEDQWPADFIAEGVDQTRGWFYTLHAIGTFVSSVDDTPETAAFTRGPTYKTCVVNGLLLDKNGVKMSKRLGNIVKPNDAIGAHGADAVRWYMLSSGAIWLPKRFDLDGVLEVRRRFLGTLLNSYKFFADYARIDEFRVDDPSIPEVSDRQAIDRWLVSRTQSVIRDVVACYDDYDLSGACRAIEHFVVDEVSNWYIRRNRRRFWKGEKTPDKLGAYATLFSALEAAARLAAPLVPFVTDSLWRALNGSNETVHGVELPSPNGAYIDDELEGSMRLVEKVVVMGRALRERLGHKIKQPLPAIHLRASDARDLDLLATEFAKDQLLDELNVKSIGSLETDDGKLCTLEAKPNFKTLGKRLGKQMKAAAATIAGLPRDEIVKLRSGESITIDVEGTSVELASEDVEIRVHVEGDLDVETDSSLVVFFDTQLDDALRAEGFAREIVVRINSLRKQSGLAIETRIALSCASEDALVLRALDEHGDMIAREVLAKSLEVVNADQLAADATRFDLGDDRSFSAVLVTQAGG
ncbi:MAG: isoleucine--tRNA ligase [Planctomycetes bacterium]|nr:isoleucine--tRNA ligase [Planctomycetota bacterium]MCB9918771.1 isoleucine--tRNA ligase [Planctomycetota bacterium]